MTKSSDKIVSTLAKYDRFVTSKELAQIIGVSPKTIYRSVTEINQKYHFPLIKSERGKGYILDYDQYLKLNGHFHEEQNLVVKSPIERRNEVITTLLFNAPLAVNINDVYEKYYVSAELIRQDLLAINNLLHKYNLNIQRHNNYVAVKGEEQQIRRAINSALVQSKAMNTESINDFASEFEDLSNYDNSFLTTQIDWIQKSLGTTIPYPYNVNIFSHLYVLIKRFRNGKVVKDTQQSDFADKCLQLRKENAKFWKISNDVIQNTADYIHRDIPEIESYYLLEYLMSMRYNHDFAIDDEVSSDASKLADYYINGFQLSIHDPKVKALKGDLISHIRPMFNRLKNRIVIANKLLDDIKSEYQKLFDCLKRLSRQANDDGLLSWKISDDEIGFLTLYFAKYFEETSLNKRVLVMCASGVGTSKLLYAKIHRNFPELDLVGIVSKSDYESHYSQYVNVDLIVSTIPVSPRNNEQVILSSAMFNMQDRNRLSRYLDEHNVD